MKNLIVYYEGEQLKTKLEDIAVPEYNDDEVLIKVVVAGSNPKDWKHPLPSYFGVSLNQGDDVSGTVSAVGANVSNFRPGDRVAGFHVMDTPRGTYAEYTVCPAHTVFHIPRSMSFEEAATLPLAAFTAAVGLYRCLRLPHPWERSDEHGNDAKVPLVVNGASSAVGAFAVKLAKLNGGIGPIVGTAGGSKEYAESVGCDVVVDYRSESVVEDILKATGGKVAKVFDAANSVASTKYLAKVINEKDPGARYVGTLGVKGEAKELLDGMGVWHEQVWVGSVHDDKPPGGKLFGAVMSTVFEMLLAEGKFSGQPYEVVPNGLDGVYGALVKLRDRKGGNEKFVYRIAETPGLSK